jgi:hypothetical protein
MRDYKKNVKLFVYLFSMIFLASSFSQSLVGRHISNMANKDNESEKMCDVNVVCALMNFEKEAQGDKVRSNEGEEPSFKGTFYLTGDFDKSHRGEIEEIVMNNLNEIGYEKISKECGKNSNLVTVINKENAEPNVDFLIKPNAEKSKEDANEVAIKSLMEKHNLSKKIIEKAKICEKIKNKPGEAQFVIRHYENKKDGIKTMVISSPKESDLSAAIEGKQLVNHSAYKPNPLKDFFHRLSQLGPKVFLDNGQEIK